MKVHAPNPRGPTWAWCGQPGYTAISDNPAEVDCAKCRVKLGLTASQRWCTPAELALIAAAEQWYDNFVTNNENEVGSWPRDDVLATAVDAYHIAVAGRRHYAG